MFNSYDVFNEVLHERRYIDECNLWDDVIRWAAAMLMHEALQAP